MKKLFIVLINLSFLFGCTVSNHTNPIGTQKIIEKSGSIPDWKNNPSKEEGDIYLIVGQMTSAADLSFGLKQAYADGIQSMMNMMQNNVKSQSSQALRGANLSEDDIGRYSEFAVAWISGTETFSMVKNPESYWEKVEKTVSNGVSYSYNCYNLLKITKKDFNQCIEGAYQHMKKKAQELNNIKAEEIANQLIDELKKSINNKVN
jgi:hypothetical protein